MIFRQLLEPTSSTYSYLLACPRTGGVCDHRPGSRYPCARSRGAAGSGVDADLYHRHPRTRRSPDGHPEAQTHGRLPDLLSRAGELPCVGIGLRESETFRIGHIELHPLITPGHTDTHHCYLIDNGTQRMLFSGDALPRDACGRTDFQSGSAATLYHSRHDKLFTLPGDTLVYPAHDYEGRFVSTIAQEKKRNPRLKNNKSLQDFVAIMDNLDLPYPKKIDFAVPGNRRCGHCPPDVPEEFRAPREFHDQG